MIYVTSDLHGFPPEKFQAFLQQAGFSEQDFLYVLGDVIDRGEYGAELLLWLSSQPNMQLILGNHEAMMLSCDFLFKAITEENLKELTAERLDFLNNWMSNGAEPTINGFKRLAEKDKELIGGILDYLYDAPLWEEIEVSGRKFVLVHAGLGNFSINRPLSDYRADELVWSRPLLETRYFEDRTVIFGHTPTLLFGRRFRGKMIKTDTWCCIDTGTAAGLAPMLLRLDDMQEFYFPTESKGLFR